MCGDSQSKKLQDLTDSVLSFVSNKIPLNTHHLRANQAPYMSKEISTAIITRLRLNNIYLETMAQENKKI